MKREKKRKTNKQYEQKKHIKRLNNAKRDMIVSMYLKPRWIINFILILKREYVKLDNHQQKGYINDYYCGTQSL